MTPEQAPQVRRLFEEALEIEPEQRAAWLGVHADGALRTEVERLLWGRASGTEFLNRVGASLAAAAAPALASGLTGSRVGPWELLDPLGHGGMGTVYRAARADDAYRKIVAVKLLGFQCAGPEMELAFRMERQILASLEHPNIARLIDGGATPEGLLYIAMELVDGEPIDLYCQHRELSIDARLALFEDVCSAVQYAHRNLIVHRDLKPKNILVAPEGQVKLLDFGIAKVLSDSGAPAATMQGVMTLQYASPEQVLGKPITTASDVYNDVRSLATTVLFDIHDNIKNLAGSTQARKLVIDKGLHYLEALARDSEGDAGLQAELAAGYERAGSVIGGYFDSNTEGGRAAAPILEKALLLRKKLVAQKPDDIEAIAALGMSFLLYGNNQIAQGDFTGAIASYGDALALPTAAAFRDHPSWLRVQERAVSSLCNTYPVVGKEAAAIPICEESVRLASKLSTENPSDKEMAFQWAMNEGKLANALRQSDRLPEAALHFRICLERIQELIRENPSNSNLHNAAGAMKFYLARTLDSLKDPSTLVAYSDAVETLEANRKANPGDQRRIATLAYALKKYSELLLKAGRSKEAEAAFERGLVLYLQDANKPAAGAAELSAYAETLVNSPFSRLRNPVLALELAERANELTKGREPLIVNTLALAYHSNGRIEDAIRTARTALALLPSATGPSIGLRKEFESNIARFESGQKSPR